jgi:hypothetical protein
VTGHRMVTVSDRGEWDEDDDDQRLPTVPYEVPDRLVFHWSPVVRRRQIIRYGLRPRMRATITALEWRAPYVCFADSPSWAWALSAGMPWAPAGEWDLWQTWLSDLGPDIEVIPDPSRQSGMYEIRTGARVFKRHLWHVGTRIKT